MRLVLASLAVSAAALSLAAPAHADPAWDALVREASTKNAPLNIWGMDRAETRHNFTLMFVKEEGKIYIMDDEDTERDLTHTVWVTDASGEKSFYGVAYTHPYGRGATIKTDMTGMQDVFKDYKNLLLSFAASARPSGTLGDCAGKGPAAEHITWAPKNLRFTFSSCSQFTAPRAMTHPSPMTGFEGWTYAGPKGYELVLEIEAGSGKGTYNAVILALDKDGKVTSSEELGSVSDAELEAGRTIPVPGGSLSSF